MLSARYLFAWGGCQEKDAGVGGAALAMFRAGYWRVGWILVRSTQSIAMRWPCPSSQALLLWIAFLGSRCAGSAPARLCTPLGRIAGVCGYIPSLNSLIPYRVQRERVAIIARWGAGARSADARGRRGADFPESHGGPLCDEGIAIAGAFYRLPMLKK